MSELVIEKLEKEFGSGLVAVRGLDLAISSGELTVLLGSSGCGKTTTLRMIAGLETPSAGDIRFDGQSVLSVPAEKRGVGMVFQQDSLFPFMTVAENIAYGLRVRRIERSRIRSRVAAALQAVQLPGFHDRRPAELSGGQRQRVALARCLVLRPRILLMDEPLSQLDRELRLELRQMITSVQRSAGITTLFVTHDQSEAVAIGDRIALMVDGQIRQIGRPRDFYERPVDLDVARFFGAGNLVPGRKQGTIVETGIGNVEVSASAQPDGPVFLMIRPEVIEMRSDGHNNFPARVTRFRFLGANAQLEVGINGTHLSVSASPYCALQEGDRVMLHVPKDRICVLPPQRRAPNLS